MWSYKMTNWVTLTIPFDLIIAFVSGMIFMILLIVLAYEIDAYLTRKSGKIF